MNIKDTIRLLFKIRFLERFILKKVSNREYNSTNWAKFIPNNYSYKSPTLRKVERDGVKYSLDLSELIDWHIYFGIKEPSKHVFFELIKPGNIVMDVGANIGDMTLNFAKQVGETGNVYSFEPFLPSFNKLKKNIEMNQFRGIHPFNIGLGDTSGTFFLEERDNHNSGMNRIATNIKKKGHAIKVTTLDQFIKDKNIAQIDFIKIDVEGFEKKILNGSKELLTTFKPVLFIELDDNYLRDQGDSAKELIELLEGYNYSISIAGKEQKINSSFKFNDCHFDILCQ
jgi:FkbM family methyltransferase